jgi:hypothetical protein
MSTLVAQLDAELLTAIKERDDFARDTLRFLKSVLKNAEIDGGQALTDEQAVAIIQKEVKKRHEAVAAFTQAQNPKTPKPQNPKTPFKLTRIDIDIKIKHLVSWNLAHMPKVSIFMFI